MGGMGQEGREDSNTMGLDAGKVRTGGGGRGDQRAAGRLRDDSPRVVYDLIQIHLWWVQCRQHMMKGCHSVS